MVDFDVFGCGVVYLEVCVPVGKEAANEPLENVWDVVLVHGVEQAVVPDFVEGLFHIHEYGRTGLFSVDICVSWNSLSFVPFFALNPACSSFIILFVSTYCVNLVLIIFSIIFDRQLMSAIACLIVFAMSVFVMLLGDL